MASDEENDALLFREAVRGTRRLCREPRAGRGTPPAPPSARFARAHRAALPETVPSRASAGAARDADGFRRAGVQESVLRRLRRGRIRTEAQLDLHGLTEAQAVALAEEFLLASARHGRRCVRLIHGKGLRPDGRGSVLRGAVHALLRRLPLVAAYTAARPAAGGRGATEVLLLASGGAGRSR